MFLQVRIVLEDAAQLGSQRLDIMEDELERYREYKQYADAGVQSIANPCISFT